MTTEEREELTRKNFYASVDSIQHRYGWSDEYVLDHIPNARFMQLSRDIKGYLAEETKETMMHHAFTSYLVSPPERMTFGQYLDKVGLGEDKKTTVKEAMTAAKRVREKFRAALKEAEARKKE